MGSIRESFAALSERRFRLLWTGQALSAVGDSLIAVALAFAVLKLTGSATDLGIVFAANTVPRVVLTLFAGVWADRLPRNLVMRSSDLVRAAAQAFVAVDLLTGNARVWHLAAAAAVYATATAFFQPAISGIVPDTVRPEHLQQANALMGLTRSAVGIAGPGISGVLVATVGAGWVYVIDSASFLASAVSLTLVTVTAAIAREQRTGFFRELAEGWSIVTGRVWLWANFVGFAVANFCVAAYLVLGPKVALDHLGGAAAWGALSACWASGAVLGSAVSLRYRPGRPLLVCCFLWILNGLQTLFFAGPAPVVVLAVTAVLGGFGLGLGNTIWTTVLQQQVPRAALSRVTSYDWMVSLLFMPLGFVLAGPLADAYGFRATLLAVGGTLVVLTLAIAAVPDVRRIRLGGGPASAEAVAATARTSSPAA